MIAGVVVSAVFLVCATMLTLAVRADIKNQEKINAKSKILDDQIVDFAKRCTAANKKSEFQPLIDEGVKLVSESTTEKQLVDIMFYGGMVHGKIMSLNYKKD